MNLATPYFHQIQPRIVEITFSFPEFAPAHTKSVHSTYSWDTVNFRALWPVWPYPSDHAHPTFFDKLLIYVDLCQHVKNQAISLICSGDMVDQKILQSDWQRIFWSISHELKFSQIWDLCRNTASNINFHYRWNSVKSND